MSSELHCIFDTSLTSPRIYSFLPQREFIFHLETRLIQAPVYHFPDNHFPPRLASLYFEVARRLGVILWGKLTGLAPRHFVDRVSGRRQGFILDVLS